MIITRTPYRLSYFGGGTDYHDWFERYGGAVLACAIDKHCFVTYRRLPRFFEHRNRIVYSAVEHTGDIAEIKHPTVRATLNWLGVHDGVELHHDGDLPARSGIGSSSAFVVGLLNAVHTAAGRRPDARRLALDAYHVERELAGEVIGYQDQILAAYGGFRHVVFRGHDFEVVDHGVASERLDELLARTLLVFTGGARDSSAVAASYLRQMDARRTETKRTQEMVGEALEVLRSRHDLAALGELLHESWELKKRRGSGISTPRIDAVYAAAHAAGAGGGKITGAGGAGFMMFLADPDVHARIIMAVTDLGCLHVPFRRDDAGSVVVYNDETDHAPVDSGTRA